MREILYLGYQSALEYLCRERYFEGAVPFGWEYYGDKAAPSPSERTDRVRVLARGCPSDACIRSRLDGALRGLATPVHLLVSRRQDCLRSGLKVAHLWSAPALWGSFARVDDGLYVSSPEFCVLQMARLLTTVELVRLIDELCGTYVLAPCPEDPYRNAFSLTSVVYLRDYLTRAKAAGVRGAQEAARALRFAADGAASPMETILSLLLCLPCRSGGYGVPLATFNQRPRDVPGADPAMRGCHRCDLLWRREGVALEYEGEKTHAGAMQTTRDSQRDNALAMRGQALIKVTKAQVYDVDAFDVVARQVLGLLGRRLRPDHHPKDWQLRRANLRDALLPARRGGACHERVGRRGSDELSPWRRS